MRRLLKLLLLAPYRYAMIPLRRARPAGTPDAFVFRFNDWKTWIVDWLPGRRPLVAPYGDGAPEILLKWIPLILAARDPQVYVWSYREPALLARFCRWRGIPIRRVEDGFIRSVSLGATQSTPLSLCIDPNGLYFDATRPSSLETFLETHVFTDEEIARGRALRERLLATAISKYNLHRRTDLSAVLGPKTRRRVLVVGQVEGDMSILLGAPRPLTNTELVRQAAAENPDAEILFKPHPESALRKKPRQTNPLDVAHIARILDPSVSLADAFAAVDHVYTITSLAGFEALWRGLPVTCLGAPFYAGWGATEDRFDTGRRTRRHDVDALLYAAYVWYPTYRDPEGRALEAEEAIALLAVLRDRANAAAAPAADPVLERLLALERKIDRLLADGRADRHVLDVAAA